MLGRLELILGFMGAWILAGAVLSILNRKKGNALPSNCVVIEINDNIITNKLVGSSWTRMMILIGFGIGSLAVIGILLLNMLGLWESIPDFYLINFPSYLNWIGLGLIWMSYFWGTMTLYYNPNYTPLYSHIKRVYILAMGGPYRLVRHPMYIQKAVFPILLFMTSGFWPSLLGLISWIALPKQMQMEEYMLKEIFGKTYEEYMKKTGRIIPKIHL